MTFSFFPKVQSSLWLNFLPVAVFTVLSSKVEPSQSFQLDNYGDDFRPATPPGLQFRIYELWQYFVYSVTNKTCLKIDMWNEPH